MELELMKMFVVNCPKTRNEEFGQLLEALTEKYCQTVMKLDELIKQFDTLKGKNDTVIQFQEENFHKHDSGLDDVVTLHKRLEEKQQKDHDHLVKEMEKENATLKQIIADQEVKLETIIKEKEVSMKAEDEKLGENLKEVESVNKEQEAKIQKSDARIDNLKASIGSHSEILEAILKELKEKDVTIESMSGGLDTLMKERDGGNDLIKDEFDAKIKKVYDEIAVKANTDIMNELFTKNSEEITNVKTSFEEKVSDIEKKQTEMIEKQTETASKTEDIVKVADEVKEASKQITDNLKSEQEAFKVEIKSLKDIQIQSESKLTESVSQINQKIDTMNSKQTTLSTNFGKLEGTVSSQMEEIDKKTEETQNNLKDLQHVTNTFDDKVGGFSKSLRMEFRETKDDMVKKIDEHVQLAIQDSRARNDDLVERMTSKMKKQEDSLTVFTEKVKTIETGQESVTTNLEGKISEFVVDIDDKINKLALGEVAKLSTNLNDLVNVKNFMKKNLQSVNGLLKEMLRDSGNILLFHGLELVSMHYFCTFDLTLMAMMVMGISVHILKIQIHSKIHKRTKEQNVFSKL